MNNVNEKKCPTCLRPITGKQKRHTTKHVQTFFVGNFVFFKFGVNKIFHMFSRYGVIPQKRNLCSFRRPFFQDGGKSSSGILGDF